MTESTSPVSLTIDPKAIQSIIHAQIQAAIVSQMRNAPGLIEKLANAAINQNVDSDGNPSSYGRQTLIECMTAKAIKIAIEEATREWVKENQALLKKAIADHLTKNRNEFVKKFVTGAHEAISAHFSARCEIKFGSGS